jgi:hypothetical protein
MGGANGSRECARDHKLRDTHHVIQQGDGFRKCSTHPTRFKRNKASRNFALLTDHSMNIVSFTWEGEDSLAEQLARGIERLSTSIASNDRPIAVTLWHGNGSGLRIRSKMCEIAERCEVGVLEFTKVFASPSDEIEVSLPRSFRGPLNVKKMIVTERGVLAESGVTLEDMRTEEIVIVAGAYPHTLAVRVPLTVPAFEPEYPLDRYQLVDLK